MTDLHIHSDASDGFLSPGDLIAYGASKGLRIMALTDHDTVAGIDEASVAAQQHNITFIPGIELNIQWPTGEFHLLGLGLKNPSSSLLNIIAFLQESRNTRNDKILKKMQAFGIKVSAEELFAMFSTKALGRPHFAEYLVSKKIVKTRQQAFDKYLGRNKEFYIGHEGANLAEAVIAVKESGGIPVIAHPMSLYVSWGKLEGVLQNIFNTGVEGLEAWHPAIRISEAQRLEELGRKLGFFITAGSDFHGKNVRSDRKIGKTSGGLSIDDRFWFEELKPRLNIL
ncbi:MAG: PHP domain-containing protein [Spirochaetales bacterium]